LAGVLFFLGGMALAGIPPMNGFVSKLALFQSGVAVSQAQPVDGSTGVWVPLLLMGLSSILTLVYVFRGFMTIWWEPFEPESPEQKVKSHGDSLLAPAGLITLCLVLGLWGEPLINLAANTSAWLREPQKYVRAVMKANESNRRGAENAELSAILSAPSAPPR